MPDVLKVGALFAGYGGIELALADVLGPDRVQVSWYAEWDPQPARIMAHHHPGVPNLWDVTTVDWSSVEPVDIITGGSPCQDLSHAGKRAGMKAGTRSGLWASMCDAIDIIRPRLVVWENVRGALSAEADSAVEHCPGCMGDRPGQPVLRALGRVLGDLADIGYDASWYGLRAADVGAAHGRFRVFLFATPADPEHAGRAALGGVRPAAAGFRPTDADSARPGDDGALTLLKTPTSNLAVNGGSQHPDKRRAGGHGPDLQDEVEHLFRGKLLPTARAAQGETRNSTVYRRVYEGEEVTNNLENAVAAFADPEHGEVRVSGDQTLLPTPTVSGSTRQVRAREDYRHNLEETAGYLLEGRMPPRRGAADDEDLFTLPIDDYTGKRDLLPTPATTDAATGYYSRPASECIEDGNQVNLANLAADEAVQWGDYAPAIRRAETYFAHRPAPAPTEPGPNGRPSLSARFVEWHMGLPDGWVTDPVIWEGIRDGRGRLITGHKLVKAARDAALKALGNGVVFQQAAAAFRAYLTDVGALTPEAPIVPAPAVLLPTPNPFHMSNDEDPQEWRERRLDVFTRTGTRHGPALSVIARSIADGDPLTPDRYMPEGENLDDLEDAEE